MATLGEMLAMRRGVSVDINLNVSAQDLAAMPDAQRAAFMLGVSRILGAPAIAARPPEGEKT